MGYFPPRLRSHGRYVSWSVARRLTLIASKLDPRKDPTMAKNSSAWTHCHPCGADRRCCRRASSASWRPVRGRGLRRVGGTGVEVALEGVWELPKAAVAIARGAPVFWDARAGNVAADIGTSNALIGGAPRRGAPLTQRSESDLTACSVRGCPRRSAIHFRDLTFGRIILRKHAGSTGRPEAENTPAGFLR